MPNISEIEKPLIAPDVHAADLVDRAELLFADQFEVKRLVAASAVRALFVVHDTILKREVVLRVHLQPDTRSRRWFERETELLACLDHPALRAVHSGGHRDTWAFRVAKWIEGESLETAAGRSPRPIRSVLALARSLTSLLEYIHSNQIAVRRIVPATLMLETTGRSVVTDLRYASPCIDVADDWDDAGLPFVAPEIRGGAPGDPCSDIYTAGALLYFALTGQVPPADCCELKTPSELRPASPVALDRVIMRALEFDPSGRYLSAAEMNDDLTSDLGESTAELPVVPQSGSAYEDARTWEKRLRRALGDEYELLGELGSGGFGRVYHVRDLDLEREVALKVLHPFLTADPDVVERFRREAQLAGRIMHPHIVNTYDIGGRAGLLWYTMEYVDGPNLAQFVEREGRISIDRVLRIVREALAGLQHAHRHGLVHRDLKPENILLHDSTGDTLIADFGLALALKRPDRFGGASSHSGTPAFAAPEQMLGEKVDHRVDLYSLALCAYFALTGAEPFGGGSTTAILARQTVGALPDLASIRSDVPLYLIEALTKGAALDPERRYESAEAFAAALIQPTAPRRKGLFAWLRRP